MIECFYRGKKCGMPDFKTVYTRYGKDWSKIAPFELLGSKTGPKISNLMDPKTSFDHLTVLHI